MSEIFFPPRKGSKYQEGIYGLKVMVIGASFYCKDTSCRYFKECTDDVNPQTGKYNDICPSQPIELHLSDSAQIEIDSYLEGSDDYVTYKNFTPFMCETINKLDVNSWDNESFWDHVVFTNYVQYMLGHGDTQQINASYRQNQPALDEMLHEYKPDVLIVWGTIVNKPIKCALGVKLVEGSESTLGTFTFEGREVVFINPYHPSSSYFHKKKNQLAQILTSIFGNK